MARVPAKGSILSYDLASNSPRTFVQLLYITDMPSPTGNKEEIDARALEDAATVSFLDIPDFGTVTIQGFMDPKSPTQYLALRDHFDADDVLEWRITNPVSEAGGTASTHIWQGRVQQLSTGRAVRGMVTQTIVIRNTGAETFTAET